MLSVTLFELGNFCGLWAAGKGSGRSLWCNSCSRKSNTEAKWKSAKPTNREFFGFLKLGTAVTMKTRKKPSKSWWWSNFTEQISTSFKKVQKVSFGSFAKRLHRFLTALSSTCFFYSSWYICKQDWFGKQTKKVSQKIAMFRSCSLSLEH